MECGLLPLENFFVDVVAEDGEEEFELPVGEAWGGVAWDVLGALGVSDGGEDGVEGVFGDGEGAGHDVVYYHHAEDVAEEESQLRGALAAFYPQRMIGMGLLPPRLWC